VSGSQIFDFGEFRLDTVRRVLLRHGDVLPLTPRLFDTLSFFVRNHGRVLEKDELMREIWPDSFVEESNLHHNVSVLRRTLGEGRGDNRYIVTVPGRGYKFAADVKAMEQDLAASRDVIAGSRIIAVLPFKPIVAQNRDEALEFGMADTLIAQLSQSKQMIVRPLSSVRRYGGLEQDPQIAGRELGAHSVLDGSIQRSDDRIRVTSRLINVEDGASLWAGTFDEKFTDVFAVQDAISERVSEALSMHLDAEERRALTRRYTENTEAYDLYLKGRYHWNKLIPPEVRESIQFFQRAIELDPTYALAYGGIAEAYRSLPISADVRPKLSCPLAKEAAARALDIDDSLADVHATLSILKCWYDWDWTGAEREARRAIALNANLSEAHRAYGLVLSSLGRQREAIAEASRAVELDPFALITRTLESLFLYYNGQYEEALEKLTWTLDIDPNFWIALLTMGKIYLQQGKCAEAVSALHDAKTFSGGNTQTTALIGYTWAISGDEAQARTALDELKTLSAQRYVPPHSIALVYNGLGEDDQCFRWLERAVEERDVLLSAFIAVDPTWTRLSPDLRFKAVLHQLNLEPSPNESIAESPE
jgi:DNA-binding winged helix-turn-helix (wHTH) protein/tetratricopeptide (TPR) repeat protein